MFLKATRILKKTFYSLFISILVNSASVLIFYKAPGIQQKINILQIVYFLFGKCSFYLDIFETSFYIDNIKKKGNWPSSK